MRLSILKEDPSRSNRVSGAPPTRLSVMLVWARRSSLRRARAWRRVLATGIMRRRVRRWWRTTRPPSQARISCSAFAVRRRFGSDGSEPRGAGDRDHGPVRARGGAGRPGQGTGVSSLFAMELMPRITRAQVMDVLSSQANLAGYRAVVDAAAEFGRAFPMMMTAAGTVPAARVFVMGAGVAGLQAVATARRVWARWCRPPTCARRRRSRWRASAASSSPWRTRSSSRRRRRAATPSRCRRSTRPSRRRWWPRTSPSRMSSSPRR